MSSASGQSLTCVSVLQAVALGHLSPMTPRRRSGQASPHSLVSARVGGAGGVLGEKEEQQGGKYILMFSHEWVGAAARLG